MNKYSRSLSGRTNLIIVLTALLTLAACTGMPRSQSDSEKPSAAAIVAEPAPLETEIQPAAEEQNLPKVELTDELLYKIVSSEIAYQRGNWQAAYVTLLSVAEKTRDPRFAQRSTEIALAARQLEDALAAVQIWRQLAPESNEATQYYLSFMAMQGNLTEIKTVMAEKLRTVPANQRGAYMLQTQRLLARGKDKAAALQTLEDILAPYMNTADAHLSLAQAAYLAGDKPRTISEARMALKLKPDSQLAVLSIAQALSAPEDALNELHSFLQTYPAAKEVRLAYGSLLIDQKQFDKANLEFERLLREKPQDLSTLYTLGVLNMEKNKPLAAEQYFNEFLAVLEAHPEEDRDPSSVLVNLSQIAADRKDYAAAEQWLAKVDSYGGKNALYFNVQVRRAQLLAKQNKLDEARQFLHDVPTADEAEKVQLIQIEAQLLREAKMTDEAGKVLEAGMRKYKDNPDLIYDYAMVQESQNKIVEMEVALRRVIELAPNNQQAYNALGYSLADRNIRLDEAQSLIEKALQLAPDDPFILDSLGWVKFRQAQFDDAEKALRRAYSLRPDVEIAVHLGEVLWSRGQKENAHKIWLEAKNKDPDNETLKSTLQRLKVKP